MIGTNFVRGSNPVWYFVNLVGAQLDGSYYLWTLSNTIPYNPQAVYHDVNGLIPWTDPIQFLANGTLPVDIFFDNTKAYRLEIRQNDGTAPPSQADALIYLAENYIPNGGDGGITPLGAGVITGNQITNPQFSLINFQSPLVLTGVTNPDPIEIAPDWFLVLSGTGSITVEQLILNTALPSPTNAPYALKFLSSGWSNPPILRQRFAENGMNWQDKTVATSITARIDGGSQNIIARMRASNGSPVGNVLINAPLTNAFTEFPGNTLVPNFVNLDLPPNAYLDYEIILPQNGTSYITSVQVTESATATDVEYQQDSINRQIDHTFHYYNPKLQYKPIPSYLIGWDFPLNPAQALGDAVPIQAVGANKSYYAWDQTILFQTVNNALTVARSLTDGISITVQQAGSFAMIQYLGRAQALELLSGRMAVYLEGSSISTIEGTITIWATDDATLPDLKSPNFDSLVSAVDATGTVTAANGTWTKVTRGSFPDVRFELNGNLQQFSFNGWELPGDPLILSAEYIAIVIAFETAAVANAVEIDKIGLYAGDIATRPAPKSVSESQSDCEFLYEKTYESQTVAGTAATSLNQLVAPMQAGPIIAGPVEFVLQTAFDVNYKTIKRVNNPLLEIYSPTLGTANRVDLFYLRNGATVNTGATNVTSIWGTIVKGDKNASYIPTTNSNQSFATFDANTPNVYYITYQAVIDARFGIVL